MPRKGIRTPVGEAIEARARQFGFRSPAALAARTGKSVKTITDLLTGRRASFDGSTFVALDAALRVPHGTTEDAFETGDPSLILRARRHDGTAAGHGAWLASLLEDGGCTAGPRELAQAGRNLLDAEASEPAMRDAALALLAVARALSASQRAEATARQVAERPALTRADRDELVSAAVRRDRQQEPPPRQSSPVPGVTFRPAGRA